jgi:hypothetical protein
MTQNKTMAPAPAGFGERREPTAVAGDDKKENRHPGSNLSDGNGVTTESSNCTNIPHWLQLVNKFLFSERREK